MKLPGSRTSGVLLLWLAATAIGTWAQTFNTVAIFNGTDGAQPERMTLVQGTDGSFYGTTAGGGANGTCYFQDGCGTVFKVSPQGVITRLYSFCEQPNCTDGDVPWAGLALTVGGELYGTTIEYGPPYNYGSVFKLTHSGELSTLHQFNGTDGAALQGGLVQGLDGDFYGVTEEGGDFSCDFGCGTFFKITSDGVLTTLHMFSSGEGAFPNVVFLGTDGNFYGTTSGGGTGAACNHFEGCGTAFKITPDGTLMTLYSFCEQTNCADGLYPISGLAEGEDGNFYGTTLYGGTGGGTIFKVTPSGTLTTIHVFGGPPNDGAWPYGGLVQATDGKFYGTTTTGGFCCGTIFSIIPDGTYAILYDFAASAYGGPVTTMVQGTDGSLYGTTIGGGVGFGTVFNLNAGLAPFVTFIRPFGKVGEIGPIIGQGLTGTTRVAINGIEATFTVLSDTHIRATVPAGATTGYVTVATPTGVLTSNVPFRVIE